MSSRALKSVTLVTKPATGAASGAWTERQIAINVIGLDEPAEDIGLALVRKGVSILRLVYDPKQLVRHRNFHACAPAYRALALTHRLAKEPGRPQTRIFGYPFRFDQVTAFPCDVAIVINPNRPMCAFCNAYFEATQTPYVQVTLSPDGAEGCVLLHQVQPCLSGLETGSCPPQWKRSGHLRERCH